MDGLCICTAALCMSRMYASMSRGMSFVCGTSPKLCNRSRMFCAAWNVDPLASATEEITSVWTSGGRQEADPRKHRFHARHPSDASPSLVSFSGSWTLFNSTILRIFCKSENASRCRASFSSSKLVPSLSELRISRFTAVWMSRNE